MGSLPLESCVIAMTYKPKRISLMHPWLVCKDIDDRGRNFAFKHGGRNQFMMRRNCLRYFVGTRPVCLAKILRKVLLSA
jgi:hypothetical protein